jgi:hypothetical protein
MKIINNLESAANHLEEIKQLANESDELIFFSPFCYPNFEGFFNEILHEKIKHITFVTTLNFNSEDVFNKSESFLSFATILKNKNIACSIKIDNKLHGKLYFFLNDGKKKKAIITSANLTDNGMKTNHEWGYLIEDAKQINDLFEQANNVEGMQVFKIENINELKKRVKEYEEKNPSPKKPPVLIDITDLFENEEVSQEESSDLSYENRKFIDIINDWNKKNKEYIAKQNKKYPLVWQIFIKDWHKDFHYEFYYDIKTCKISVSLDNETKDRTKSDWLKELDNGKNNFKYDGKSGPHSIRGRLISKFPIDTTSSELILLAMKNLIELTKDEITKKQS